MDKTMMYQLMRKIAYQYYCDTNFSNKCMILQSIKYNFYFYIHLDKLTNDVCKRLLNIENISFVYSEITSILDEVINHLNFNENEGCFIDGMYVDFHVKNADTILGNKIQMHSELFELVINSPHNYFVDDNEKLNVFISFLDEVKSKLNHLSSYALGEVKEL